MPVLMNKGDDPRRAAWLFYTDRAQLDGWGRQIVEGRWDSARLAVDEDELAAAKKASSPVQVWAQAKTLIPEDFDLEAARGEVMERTQAAIERAKEAAEGGVGGTDGAGDSAQDAQDDEAAGVTAAGCAQGVREDGDTAPDAAEDAEAQDADDSPFDYEPVPAPDGLRVLVGTTTRQAAQSYLAARKTEGDGEAADTDLPGLQMLAQLIDYMRDSADGLPSFAIWHIDEAGILRMVRAKKVKAMAGNVLSVKN